MKIIFVILKFVYAILLVSLLNYCIKDAFKIITRWDEHFWCMGIESPITGLLFDAGALLLAGLNACHVLIRSPNGFIVHLKLQIAFLLQLLNLWLFFSSFAWAKQLYEVSNGSERFWFSVCLFAIFIVWVVFLLWTLRNLLR